MSSLISDGAVVRLTAARTGNADDIVWSWSKPAGSSAPSSSSSTLQWTYNGDTDAGTYSVTATSATATDSPQMASATLVTGPPLL